MWVTPSSLAIGYANEHNSTRFIETIQHIRIQDSADQGLDLMQYTQTRSRFSCHKAISCITHDKSADSNDNPVGLEVTVDPSPTEIMTADIGTAL